MGSNQDFGTTGLSFSDEDSLLDFGGAKPNPPKKMQPPNKSESKPLEPVKSEPKRETINISSNQDFKSDRISGAAGLGLGFTDDESELTLTDQPIKEKPKRAVSPVQEENNDDWLNDLLGKPTPNKPDTKPDRNTKLIQESLDFSGKSIDFSDDDTEQFLIQKKKEKVPAKNEEPIDKKVINEESAPENIPRPIQKEKSPSFEMQLPVKRISAEKPKQSDFIPVKDISHQMNLEIEKLRLENENLRISQNSVRHSNNDSMTDEIQKLRHRIEIMTSENMEHINRLKRVHQDSVDLMKTEFMSQIARLKTIHNDEIEALKTASGTTSDVKDILVKVDMATASLHSIAERIESSNGRNTNHAELISELNKFMGVIKLERKQFESERERMLHFITEMDRYNREQRELSDNEKFRYQSEIQRIETERRLLEEERRKLQNEIIRKSEENIRYKNRLLEDHQKQLLEMAGERHNIAKEWAELKTAKDSVIDLLKPEALIKHEENIRQAAASAAESRVMKRELDFKLEQLNERRAELKSDLEMMKSERSEVQRQKTQLKRDEESLKSKYSDFLSDTAEGRTALEAAKRIESQLDEKRQRIDMAIENLKSERLLLRHERQAVQNIQFNNSALGDLGGDVLPPFQKPTMSALMIDDSFQADEFLNSLPPLNLTF